MSAYEAFFPPHCGDFDMCKEEKRALGVEFVGENLFFVLIHTRMKMRSSGGSCGNNEQFSNVLEVVEADGAI